MDFNQTGTNILMGDRKKRTDQILVTLTLFLMSQAVEEC